MGGEPFILILSDDDDVSEPLGSLLTRAGHRVLLRGGRDGVEELKGPLPQVLILDRDLPPAQYQEAIALLERQAGPRSIPLLILGGGASPPLPTGWHEDAARSVGRPPQPAEVLATVSALLRLAFYRPYRDLVHDLSQPVMTIHALSRSISRMPTPDDESRRAVDRLAKEADRLMTLVEEFQRKRAGRV